MYPYALSQNPYPSSPTPTVIDAQILGGQRHREAKAAILSCIDDLRSNVSHGATDKDFRLVTLIQDVGCGKTHLALHIRGTREVLDKAVISYIDLSQIAPRNMHSLYRTMLGCFVDESIRNLRESIINHLRQKAEQNMGRAKKVFNYGFLDKIAGTSLEEKAQQLLRHEIVPNYSAIHDILSQEFSPIEVDILKLLIEDKFVADAYNVETLEDIIASLAALANLNLRLLRKITLFQIDEFDSDKGSLDFVKAVINAHLPSTILMLMLTPSSYEEIRTANASVFDRLEKANYKIDLAGSNTLEEIIDIVLEYVRHGPRSDNSENGITAADENELGAKIKVIYDEFSDFRNVRSMINIMYNATENARRRGISSIDEQVIDETIKLSYPGLHIRGSVMNIPLTDFIKIRRNYNDIGLLESGLRDAVRDLVSYAHEIGVVASPQSANGKGNGIDIIYNDPYGTKVAVAVVINKDHGRSFEQISNTMKSTGFVDKVIILTNANTNGAKNGGTVVSIDRCKMIDLIYFSNKYKSNEIMSDDSQRALVLAKSIMLC